MLLMGLLPMRAGNWYCLTVYKRIVYYCNSTSLKMPWPDVVRFNGSSIVSIPPLLLHMPWDSALRPKGFTMKLRPGRIFAIHNNQTGLILVFKTYATTRIETLSKTLRLFFFNNLLGVSHKYVKIIYDCCLTFHFFFFFLIDSPAFQSHIWTPKTRIGEKFPFLITCFFFGKL